MAILERYTKLCELSQPSAWVGVCEGGVRVRGMWCVVCGACCVECVLWCVVCSMWCVALQAGVRWMPCRAENIPGIEEMIGGEFGEIQGNLGKLWEI